MSQMYIAELSGGIKNKCNEYELEKCLFPHLTRYIKPKAKNRQNIKNLSNLQKKIRKNNLSCFVWIRLRLFHGFFIFSPQQINKRQILPDTNEIDYILMKDKCFEKHKHFLNKCWEHITCWKQDIIYRLILVQLK